MEDPLLSLIGQVFYYGELRGALAFSRWMEEAQALPHEDVKRRLLAPLARQTSEEWRDTSLWAQWLERRGLSPPDPFPSIVRLMDAQDGTIRWAERFTGTNLIIEAFALHLYAALEEVVDEETGKVIRTIRRSEGRHVANGVAWVKMFLERERDSREAACEAAGRFATIAAETMEETLPPLLDLGIDLPSLVEDLQRTVSSRLQRLGIDATALARSLPKGEKIRQGTGIHGDHQGPGVV